MYKMESPKYILYAITARNGSWFSVAENNVFHEAVNERVICALVMHWDFLVRTYLDLSTILASMVLQ